MSCDTLNKGWSKVESYQQTRWIVGAGGSVPEGFCSLSERLQLQPPICACLASTTLQYWVLTLRKVFKRIHGISQIRMPECDGANVCKEKFLWSTNSLPFDRYKILNSLQYSSYCLFSLIIVKRSSRHWASLSMGSLECLCLWVVLSISVHG